MASGAPNYLDSGKPDKYDSSSDDNRHAPRQHIEFDGADRRESVTSRKASVAAKLRNPLTGMSEEDCIADVDQWCEDKGLSEYQAVFRKGALLARVNQRSDGFEYLDAISEGEKAALREEVEKRWSQPFMLYFLVVLCAGSAIVQGMDQTAVNGAQVSGFPLEVQTIGTEGVDDCFSNFTSVNLVSTMSGCKDCSMVLPTSAPLRSDGKC